MTRTDLLLSTVLAVAIGALITAFFAVPTFFEWAFERHANTASWLARPLLLLPLIWAAWARRLSGVLASVLAILTSMFWFPAPADPAPRIAEFLAMERAFLTSGWTLATLLALGSVLTYGVLIVFAFWRRSWRMGLLVAAGGALGKVLWSLAMAPETGGMVVPFALIGLVFLAAVLVGLRRRLG